MIPVPSNTKVWLAAGVTDIALAFEHRGDLGDAHAHLWTPPARERQGVERGESLVEAVEVLLFSHACTAHRIT
ncbi:hypothetical protein [Sediminimonas qiaohouensis]|uniref:hypothetical protein n=1 Tax=Sediminimonas qiaohouensis TaxID=552061 RepID=UPI00047C485C|nr:hypothetical protein [Sediminimonas qiaohouensis]